ncbi:hypothetical protein [Streptomyces venezuelae]|uniref:hypothetical protein n=1 Tax=Streptomyces venezuelae TaxID=54571 RepID=UPI001CC25DA6|nr:hypothetical protein [Streptomyces venezuelae]
MRRHTAHLLTATTLTATAITGPVTGAVALSGPLAPGDFAPLEVWPRSAAPGTTVTVNTSACGPDGQADGDGTTVGGGRFRLLPGTHENVVVGQFQVAHDARPGSYEIGATCANGTFATGDLVVTESRGPQGHVRTGVGGGTTTTVDPAKVTAGAAVLAAVAVGGTWLLRRRASGTRS